MKPKDEDTIVLVGAACELCGCWRVRQQTATVAVPDTCPHCGGDCKAMQDQRSMWNSKHRYGSYERPGSLTEAVRSARESYVHPLS